MMLQSRRSVMRLIGALMPSFAIVAHTNRNASGGLGPLRPYLERDGESIDAVRIWLVHYGITPQRLDHLDAANAHPTSDLRRSFRNDPLINAGGLLLPTGFCRYCLIPRSDEGFWAETS